MKFSKTVRLHPGKWYGYAFRLIANPAKREKFFTAFKAIVPTWTWDGSERVWWVPDIYSTLAEQLALEHGALAHDDLISVAGYRSTYLSGDGHTFETDMALLGLLPSAPLKIAEVAAYYWRTELSTPATVLEQGLREAAWERIKAHFEAAAKAPTPPFMQSLLDKHKP
jgi:hypothetical protein